MGERGCEKSREGHNGKNPVIRLRIQTLIIASFLALVAIGTAYLAGVMSGRQSFSANKPLNVSDPVKPVDEDGSVDYKKQEPILAAEDLQFAKVLRREENGPLSKLKVTPEITAIVEKKDSSPAQTETPPPPSLQKTLEAEKSEEIADYLFQVGAFKDEKTVDNLREKLEGHGLRTMMQKEGKLFLVMVRLRGTSSRAAELVGLFGELGLGEPILRSRVSIKQ